jgi:HEAT repeat protein
MKMKTMVNRFLSLLILTVVGMSTPVWSALNTALWAERIASTDTVVRASALKDLRALDHAGKIQAASILGSVLHRGPADAERAAWGLAQLGADSEPALLDLIYALSYDEESVAIAVSSAIVPMGGHAVSALERSLEDGNFFIRRRTADILGQIGPAAAPAVHSLLERLTDPQYEVQTAAEQAIRRVGAAGIPELIDAYPDGDESLRRRMVQIMSKFGIRAAAPLINIAKKDPSGYVRMNAMEALTQFQPVPKEALPVFIGALSDMDEGVRGGAVDALSTLGVDAKLAIPTLKRITTNDPDSLVRQKAADAIAVISSSETLKK